MREFLVRLVYLFLGRSRYRRPRQGLNSQGRVYLGAGGMPSLVYLWSTTRLTHVCRIVDVVSGMRYPQLSDRVWPGPPHVRMTRRWLSIRTTSGSTVEGRSQFSSKGSACSGRTDPRPRVALHVGDDLLVWEARDSSATGKTTSAWILCLSSKIATRKLMGSGSLCPRCWLCLAGQNIRLSLVILSD